MSALTGWYSADQRPAHVGVYQRHFADGLFMHLWDGENWFADGHTAPHWRQATDSDKKPYPVWRGLADKPEGSGE